MPPKDRLHIHSDLHGLRVVKCTRKSSLNAANPTKSIDDQMADLDKECDRLGLIEFARVEENVQGASAYSKNLNREGFERALRLIRENDIAVLAYWELSRSARRLVVHGELMETLEATNTLLLIGSRLYDASDPNDQMALGFNAVMDANQVSRTRSASMRGIRESAAKGYPHGVNTYGYQRVYGPKRDLIAVQIKEPEAAIVREIVDRIIAGDSQGSIARDLTTRGVPRPRAQSWHTGEIRKVIYRDAYMGKRVHADWRTGKKIGTYDAMWPAIVEEERLLRARAILNGRPGKPGRRRSAGNGPGYLLTGIIKCGRCSGPVYGNSSNPLKGSTERPLVYQCRKCKLTRSLEPVDAVVKDVVNGWLASPKMVKTFASATEGENPELVHARAELADAQAELDEGYEAGLSARGLVALERRLLPLKEELAARVARLESATERTGWSDIASGRARPAIPEDTAAGREYLAGLIEVTLLPLGRGQRFRPTSLRVRPLGVPQEP